MPSYSGVWTLPAQYQAKGLNNWPSPPPFGLFGGGTTTAYVNTIDQILITTSGNATSFGSLTQANGRFGAFSSSVRGLWAGGENSTPLIVYVTFASAGNATSFGNLTNSVYAQAGLSNSTRGIIAGGNYVNVIGYVTMATTGNATSFGQLTVAQGENPGTSASPTRGLISGGNNGSTRLANTGYITIATTGNATNFGDLTIARDSLTGCSSSTRAVMAGGYNSNEPGSWLNVIDYYTIASTGAATTFGSLVSTNGGLAACSSSTVGVFAGGYTGTSRTNVIQYVTIATTGNATNFGELTLARSGLAGCSSGHGGL